MSSTDAAILAVYYAALALLSVYGLHRLYLVRLRRRSLPLATPPPPAQWPSITIQLPVYNEPNVVERLIDAAAALRYPGAIDVQLLDDSTDETTTIAASRVAALRRQGCEIAHVRRATRDGYKAGALTHGMTLSTADLFAVFDADFVPTPDLLLQMVPHFADARVGMVQARWGHLNREESLLTRVQAIYLDGHFAIESAARCFGGRFFNFNGTAGIWRRDAIEGAGGWSASTLTEDLDLSYRAQLAGWLFVFLPGVEVCAELPGSLHDFAEQQHRWAKGAIQTARKILPLVSETTLPLGIKSETWFHLTHNSAYLLTTIVALLVVPAIVIRQRAGLQWTFLIDLILFGASSGSVLRFYVEGQRHTARSLRLRELMATLPVGIAISIRNTAAVLEGLIERGGEFRRTPKRGTMAQRRAERRYRFPWVEIVLALFFFSASAALMLAGNWVALPLLSLFLGGYGYAAFQMLREQI